MMIVKYKYDDHDTNPQANTYPQLHRSPSRHKPEPHHATGEGEGVPTIGKRAGAALPGSFIYIYI